MPLTPLTLFNTVYTVHTACIACTAVTTYTASNVFAAFIAFTAWHIVPTYIATCLERSVDLAIMAVWALNQNVGLGGVLGKGLIGF